MLDCLDTLASISRGPVFTAEEEDALHDASQMEGPEDEETGPITVQPEVAYQFFWIDEAARGALAGSGPCWERSCLWAVRTGLWCQAHVVAEACRAQKTGISLSFVIALGSLMTLGSLMSPSLKWTSLKSRRRQISWRHLGLPTRQRLRPTWCRLRWKHHLSPSLWHLRWRTAWQSPSLRHLETILQRTPDASA